MDKSMEAAYQAVLDCKGLRETSRLYNVSVETPRRRVNVSVDLDCKPEPATILNDEQEDLLCKYIIKIADMGYGLTKEDGQQFSIFYSGENRLQASIYCWKGRSRMV